LTITVLFHLSGISIFKHLFSLLSDKTQKQSKYWLLRKRMNEWINECVSNSGYPEKNPSLAGEVSIRDQDFLVSLNALSQHQTYGLRSTILNYGLKVNPPLAQQTII
jgi:hypothetical protein